MARLDVVPWSRAKIALASAIAPPTSDRMAAHKDQPRRSLGTVASLEMGPRLQGLRLQATVMMRVKLAALLGAAVFVEIATREQRARALLLKPERPTGSVILLAG